MRTYYKLPEWISQTLGKNSTLEGNNRNRRWERSSEQQRAERVYWRRPLR